jgi:hypothetical protein
MSVLTNGGGVKMFKSIILTLGLAILLSSCAGVVPDAFIITNYIYKPHSGHGNLGPCSECHSSNFVIRHAKLNFGE